LRINSQDPDFGIANFGSKWCAKYAQLEALGKFLPLGISIRSGIPGRLIGFGCNRVKTDKESQEYHCRRKLPN
jgi:hypothetical protein